MVPATGPAYRSPPPRAPLTRPTRPRAQRRRGTIIVYFLVIISVLVTGLMVTMSLASGNQVQMASLTLHRDQAFYAAEAGIQAAYWRLQNNGNWRANTAAPLTGTIGNGSYSVTAIGAWNSPVLITSVGTVGTQAQVNITAVCSPLVMVPAISLGNNFDNSGNVAINGDVQAMGNITTSGRMRLLGSLLAGGTINTQGSVDISGSSNQGVAGITVPAINVNALISAATQVVHVPPGSNNNNNRFDVTSVNLGNGGIVYFDGPITFKGSVTVTGYGTIVVNGDVAIQSAASFGSSSNKAIANLVTTGNMDVSGYLGIVGSTYVGGTITKNGGFDLTGVVVAQQNLNTNGGLNITRAQPPWFDPRANIAGAGTVRVTSFTGPLF